MAEITLQFDSSDERGRELIDGKVVKMATPIVNHHHVMQNLNGIFRRFLKGNGCRVYTGSVTVFLTQKDNFIPDIAVVCNRDIIKHDGIHGAPDLVVEILSPTTAKRDKFYKKDVYAECGVREYWLVDIHNRSVEVYALNNKELKFVDLYAVIPDYELRN